ncbi:RNA methyltransferase, TrmH family [Lancefieldella rimae]|uniref:Putative tRNA (cytidine(34)-2'-O)-methyltransferase n=2 Tax=Lancefieldella rimae TaxID=1383 RepID=B9CKC0_LANR4|nr:tRNA (cytidine(34)-2'-O)-methyltransferase [Lancefieldella rimae]EEE17889.1 putative RNA methyltransferase, TrmH family, group 2 [Lancefieldella rimae ATCC 49626]KRO03183.1 RNA methyltransferase, TrmH family [Lancefieldella rimae]
MFNLVLVEPEIPANTGNIGRTCVVSGTHLHLVGPLGFSLDDKSLKRAGMAYWKSLNVSVYDNWNQFVEKNGLADMPNVSADDFTHDVNDGAVDKPRLHFLTKKAKKTYTQATYRDGDYLIFGKESLGLSEELLAKYADECERIPMLQDSVSLVNREDWSQKHDALDGEDQYSHPVLLQQDICGNFIDPNEFSVSALNVSNAAAIVLYEALRQIGFPRMDV